MYFNPPFVADDDQSARKSTSIDVAGRGISVDEKGAASVVNEKDPLAMADNNDIYEDRSTAGYGQKEISLNEGDAGTRLGRDESKPSQEKSSLQSEEKNKEKKASKETGSAQSNTERKKSKNKERSSSEGI